MDQILRQRQLVAGTYLLLAHNLFTRKPTSKANTPLVKLTRGVFFIRDTLRIPHKRP